MSVLSRHCGDLQELLRRAVHGAVCGRARQVHVVCRQCGVDLQQSMKLLNTFSCVT